jgi:hypothetical protein
MESTVSPKKLQPNRENASAAKTHPQCRREPRTHGAGNRFLPDISGDGQVIDKIVLGDIVPF